MSISLDCYEYIIGLSRTDCECYDELDSTTSHSGLYMDELEPLSRISQALNCDTGKDLWPYMERARERSIRQFMGDASAMLMQNYKLRREPFIGSIGRAVKKNILQQVTGHYYGVRLFCADVVGGTLKITNIGGIFNTTGALTIKVYNNLNEHIGDYPINVTAGQHVRNTVSIELPLHNNYVENLEYFFLYQYAGNNAYDNDLKCNCGKFKPYFNKKQPYFGTKTEKQYGWANFAMVGGYSSSSISDLSDVSYTASNLMYGLTLDAEFRCNVNESLCKDSMDYDANPLAAAIAFAILYKSGEILLYDILRSTTINRATLVDDDNTKEDIALFGRKYTEMMRYIVDNVNLNLTDCFDCKDFIEMAKGSILG